MTRSSPETVDKVAAAIMMAFIKKWFLGSYKGPVYLDCVNGEKGWGEEARAAIEALGAAQEVLRGAAYTSPDREEIAECMWRAEFRRATGKERTVPWSECSDKTQEQYLYLADAILALSSTVCQCQPLTRYAGAPHDGGCPLSEGSRLTFCEACNGNTMHRRAAIVNGVQTFECQRCALSVTSPHRCEGCDTNYADPPSKLCQGCQAYREHQQ